MSAEPTKAERDEESGDEEAATWPAVVGVILIILFSWAGIEVFVLSGQPIATLEHEAISSDEGAAFDVAKAGKKHVVQVWSFRLAGEDDNKKKAVARLAFSVVGPSGEVVVQHEDGKAQSKARYVELVPNSAGEHRVRLDSIDGEEQPKAQAVVIAGNNQVLLPLIGKFVE